MSCVVAAAPIAAPVYRMHAELLCRDVGSSAHRAAEQLRAAGVERGEIAALLGLRLEQLDVLQAQLEGAAGARVQSFDVWVDPAHGLVLSHAEGLDLIAGHRAPPIPWLEIPPLDADALPAGRLTEAASTRGERRGRVVVDEVLSFRADVHAAGSVRWGDGQDHVLLQPDTWLVVEDGADAPVLEVRHDELIDERLTAIARATLLAPRGLQLERLGAESARIARERLHDALGTQADDVFDELALDPLEVREKLCTEIDQAHAHLVVVCNALKEHWPRWMHEAMRDARRRGVECVEHCREKGRDATRPTPRGVGIVVVRDGARAFAHSDATALGGHWRLHTLTSQACMAVHEPAAVARVLERLGVPAPRPVAANPRPEPLPDVAARGLRLALERLRDEVPAGVDAVLEEDDENAFCEQAERNQMNLHDPKKLDQLGRGIVWERILAATCDALAAQDGRLTVEAVRFQPAAENVDFDVVVANHEHRIWWILDAKCKLRPARRDFDSMVRQLAIAERRGLVRAGYEARGATVYPSTTLDLAEATPDDRVGRWRLSWVKQRLTEEPPALG